MTCAIGGFGSLPLTRTAELLDRDETLCECGRYEHPDPERAEHDGECPAAGFLEREAVVNRNRP